MNGVTIAEEILCKGESLVGVICGGICTAVICIAVLVYFGSVYKLVEGNKIHQFFAVLASLAFIFAAVETLFDCIKEYNNAHMEYVVEIDDTVTFNEFFSRYEIVSKDGDQYRVRELVEIDDE